MLMKARSKVIKARRKGMSLIERKRKRKEMEYLVIPKDQESQEAMTPLGERLLKRGYNQT